MASSWSFSARGLLFICLLVAIQPECYAAPFASRTTLQTFFPPDGGPTLRRFKGTTENVVFDFDFYHTTSYSPETLVRFSDNSRLNQALMSPIRVSLDEHYVADFHQPTMVWTFRDTSSTPGRVLATTVITQSVFNSTGHERDPQVSPPVVPAFDPDSSRSWLIGTELLDVPAPIVTQETLNKYNRWELTYKNVDSGKLTLVSESVHAAASSIPKAVTRDTIYELTMRFCHSETKQCSVSTPALPIDFRPDNRPVIDNDLLQGSGEFTIDCPAWTVPNLPKLSTAQALLDVELFRVNTDGSRTYVDRIIRAPNAFPVTRTLPYGQYVGVWAFNDRTVVNSPALLSSVAVYHHPALHHRTSYPAMPVFHNSLESWVVGPDPLRISRPTTNKGNLDDFDTWWVHYRGDQSQSEIEVRESTGSPFSTVPALTAGNYQVTLTLHNTKLGTQSLSSPAFRITVLTSHPSLPSPSPVEENNDLGE